MVIVYIVFYIFLILLLWGGCSSTKNTYKNLKIKEYDEDLEEYDEDIEEYDEDIEECDEDIEECDEDIEECDEDLEECDEDIEECDEKENNLRSNSMKYDKMTKKDLIELLEKKDKKIAQLEIKKDINSRNKEKTTSSSSPITFEIVKIKYISDYLRIELLWNNRSFKNVHFIEGTLKFYDKNNNLLGVDNNHICGNLNAHTESAYVVDYLLRCGEVPEGTSKVQVSINNIYYH